ncbi:DUF1826 domain-containing protein [Pedobacter sp. Leaf170]|uniref:DUF1826 domain-containing protein n=1 Tax=Pedobacter sp. Leaf170 TaxID=2876558 RepID=UPI001E322609|nr:DUF1826 domain-containing protein [Pedobacter sp. Leaf170]
MHEFSDSRQVKVVSSFTELAESPFEGQQNAVCWARQPEGDFEALVHQLQLKDDVTEVSAEDLLKLNLSAAGSAARNTILKDLKCLKDFGAQPTLNLLRAYPRDDTFDFISTDVYSFHVDRSPVAADTFLCTYYGAASDIIANEDVEQKVLVPEIRQKLTEIYDGDEGDFEAFLTDYFFDLHYQPKAGGAIVNLGVGHLWKLAVDYPGQAVLPCVHRAPLEKANELRLLLIC